MMSRLFAILIIPILLFFFSYERVDKQIIVETEYTKSFDFDPDRNLIYYTDRKMSGNKN